MSLKVVAGEIDFVPAYTVEEVERLPSLGPGFRLPQQEPPQCSNVLTNQVPLHHDHFTMGLGPCVSPREYAFALALMNDER